MTTTLLCKGISYQPPKIVSPNVFREDLRTVLAKLSPKYITMIDAMDDYMLSYLGYTLEYWINLLKVEAHLRIKFRETKIAEWFAFWAGFCSAGGRFPLVSSEIHLSPSSNNQELGKDRDSKIFSVIPMGTDSKHVREILQSTLRVLQKDNRIAKVYIVYDGIDPDETSDARFSKVETYSTPKRSGPAKARNIGLIEGFSREYSDALLLDSDVSLKQVSLSRLVRQYCQSGSAIGCPLISSTGTTWFDRYHNLSGTLNGRYLNSSNKSNLLFGTTSCMFISRQVYDAGLLFSTDFPEAAGEDIDYCLRAILANFTITALDNVNVFHWYGYDADDRHDWGSFLSRFERYGRGEYLLTKKHPYYHFLMNHTSERLRPSG